jgi:hypothetical protein
LLIGGTKYTTRSGSKSCNSCLSDVQNKLRSYQLLPTRNTIILRCKALLWWQAVIKST